MSGIEASVEVLLTPAGAAKDLALRSDPGYSAADLLLAALARGIDPAAVPKLRMPADAKAGDEPTNA